MVEISMHQKNGEIEGVFHWYQIYDDTLQQQDQETQIIPNFDLR